MKKSFSVIALELLSISLIAFVFINWNERTTKEESAPHCLTNMSLYNALYPFETEIEEEYYLDVNNRFNNTIKRKQLVSAKTIIDLLPEEATRNLSNYNHVELGVVKRDHNIVERSENEYLTQKQLSMISTPGYSFDYFINSYCTNGTEEDYKLVYYVSLVPDVEAEYKNGSEELLAYLKENSREEWKMTKKEKLGPGKFYFTVAENGSVENIKFDFSSGYESLDNRLMELIKSTSGDWNTARDSEGNFVKQEMAVFFGVSGC